MTKTLLETNTTDHLADALAGTNTLDFTVISPSELEGVSGGDVGTALAQGIEGTWKALHQSDAPSWEDVKNTVNSFNENYNPIYWGLKRVKNYFSGPKGGTSSPPANPPETISV
jgi:hypothetical protein